MDDIEPARCGIRAMALGTEGDMLDDFKIEYQGNSIHMINSSSPAAIVSLAYGNEIATMAKEYFKSDNPLKNNETLLNVNYIYRVKPFLFYDKCNKVLPATSIRL